MSECGSSTNPAAAGERRYRFMECTSATCHFRYPAATGDRRALRCPLCGAPASTTCDANPPASEQRTSRWSHAALPPVEVIVDNVRSIYNAGSIVRTADAIGVRHVYLCGITPTPDHPRFAKTALGAEQAVSWTHHLNAPELVRDLRRTGTAIWALERMTAATSIFETPPETRPLALIVGNENAGIDPALMAMSDEIVMLPMWGVKGSLNVATACGIALYALRSRKGRG